MSLALKLAKELDFKTEEEYFEYCVNSYINGNHSQCKEMFQKLKKDGQKELLNYISRNNVPSHVFRFYLNLL